MVSKPCKDGILATLASNRDNGTLAFVTPNLWPMYVADVIICAFLTNKIPSIWKP